MFATKLAKSYFEVSLNIITTNGSNWDIHHKYNLNFIYKKIVGELSSLLSVNCLQNVCL